MFGCIRLQKRLELSPRPPQAGVVNYAHRHGQLFSARFDAPPASSPKLAITAKSVWPVRFN